MRDEKISSNESIDAALRLDGDPAKVKQFYDEWAANYDLDTSSADYSGPTIAAKLLSRHLTDKDCKLLDAGCGTGLVGIELQALGYAEIDGFDLSESMAERAAASGVYQQVKAGVEMMQATQNYAGNSYDAVLSIGVFTLGHVPPEALKVLLELTRPGGLLLISTRTHYYDQTHYQQLVNELTASNRVTLLQLIKDAPYNHDGAGHYWVFKKPG